MSTLLLVIAILTASTLHATTTTKPESECKTVLLLTHEKTRPSYTSIPTEPPQSELKRVLEDSTYQEIESKILELLGSEERQNVVLRQVRPTWHHYRALLELKAYLEEKIKSYPLLFQSESFRYALHSKIKASLDNENAKIKILLAADETNTKYLKFLDYHISYFELSNTLNIMLGVLVFSEAPLHLLKSKEDLLKDAREIVRSIERAYESLFSSTGYKDFDEYRETVTKAGREALLKYTQDSLDIAVHRPETARFWIPIAGFQNQRVTGSSKGSYYNDYGVPTGRDIAESNLTGVNIETYYSYSPRLKPIYGEAYPKIGDETLRPNTGAYGYGSDLWVLKDSVFDRATWTPIDSLGPGQDTSRPMDVKEWSDYFIPWKYRFLMASYSYTEQLSPLEHYPPLKGYRFSRGSSYFEVQIFGPLSITDVKAFHFMGNPPDQEFYNYLISKNIEVWDARTYPPKKFTLSKGSEP